MFCKYCGAQVPEGKFCPDCGRPLEQSEPLPAYRPVGSEPVYADIRYGQPLGSRSALDVVRRVGSSTTMLVAAILLSAAIVFTFLSSMTMPKHLADSMQRILDLMRANGYGELIESDQFREMFELWQKSFSGGSVVSAFTGLIPSGLFLAGVWMVYLSAKKREEPMSVSGLSLLKVLAVIALVFLCIGAALSGILGLSAFLLTNATISHSGADVSAVSAILVPVAILVLTLLIAVFTLVILYQVKLIKLINTVSSTITSGVPNDRIPTFVAVILYIGAAFEILGSISLFGTGLIFTGLAGLCTAGAEICFGMLIYRYRNEMTAFMMGR